MSKNLGMWLLAIGIGMNLVEAFTSKEGVGGVLFGTSGVLRGVNDMIPLPKSIAGIPMNLGGYVALIGAGIWAYKSM